MKRFLSSIALCTGLLAGGLFLFMPSTGAQPNYARSEINAVFLNPASTNTEVVLTQLLSLPAPPPPNPFYRPSTTERDENFFSKKNPPADDAPIDDLLAYWKHQNRFDPKYSYTAKPSEKTVARLLNEIEKKPEMLTELIGTLPASKETAEFVKKIYDDEMSNRVFGGSWREEIKQWLTYRSPYFSNELYQAAMQASDTEEYVINQEEVLALARVDWERAKPILERLLSNSQQPISQTLARWAYYNHARATGDSFDAEKYRKELQETVENKSLQPGNRDLAMDALVHGGDFPGRDDWYFSLLEDETLYDLRVNGQSYTGLTTLINMSPDDRYVAKMVELAASSNPAVRSAAVRNLAALLDDEVATKNPEVVRALLPWLENPKWAKEADNERTRIVGALQNLSIPESVPGLIAMLNESVKQDVTLTMGNTNAVSSRAGNFNAARSETQSVVSYPFRSAAIAALEKQRSPQAASALRTILPAVENWERQSIVKALLASSGFSVSEQLAALEEASKYALDPKMMPMTANTNSTSIYWESGEFLASIPSSSNLAVTNSAMTANSSLPGNQPYDPEEVQGILASQLMSLEEPGDELVKAVIDRIDFHEKKNPQTAFALRQIVQHWKGAAINALLLRDVRDGKSNLTSIVKLLGLRKELREKQSSDVTDIRAGKPFALGVAACLLEQTSDYDAILDGGADEAKIALLGCARLIRAPLPLAKTAENLKSQNKLLALAAERYLESEDSIEARQIVLAHRPNEAVILGARTSFLPDEFTEKAYVPGIQNLFASVDRLYEKFPPYSFYGSATDNILSDQLREEVKTSSELLGIYAYDNNFVRIYKDKAVFSYQDDPARYRERTLADDEFEALKNFFAARRVDELPPFLSVCGECRDKELLMLGRAGGRRVYVKADPLPEFFSELEAIFAEFRQPPAQIRYYLEKDVPGLQVLFADDNKVAVTLWKDGDDFRLAVDDVQLRRQNERAAETEAEETVDAYRQATEEGTEEDEETAETEKPTPLTPEKRALIEQMVRENIQKAQQKAYGSFTWYKFDKTKLLEPTAQPAGVEFIPPADGFAVPPNEQQWKARAAGVEVRADQEGLYRIKNGQFAKIGEGYYQKPLVTPDGRWALALKYTYLTEQRDYERVLVRHNLLTNKEFKVKIDSEYGQPAPVAYIAALNKVLVFSGYGDESEPSGAFFLLDAQTGVVQPLKGEALPLLRQTFRPLQAVAGVADSFWAATPDAGNARTNFGIYNARTLSFKTLLTIPRIMFNSMNMWVDEREGKIYFVYEGHLLALPLPKNR